MNWIQSVINAIYREYDRRIKQASEVTEYGADHGHGHGHTTHASHADHGPAAVAAHPTDDDHADDNDDGAVEISNVPPGTRVGQTAPPQDTP